MRSPFILVLFLLLAAPGWASFRFQDGRVCTDVPFRLLDNRAVHDVTVEGRGPFHFIFDTGANSILDAGRAREMGVSLTPHGQAGGAGAQTQAQWRTRLKHLSFGAVEAADVDFLAIDLSAIRDAIGFERLDGLMGREVLASFLVRYDYDRSVLTLCDRAKAPDEMRQGVQVPFEWNDWEVPIIAAVVDGRPGRFILDTGDRSSLTLFKGFIARNG